MRFADQRHSSSLRLRREVFRRYSALQAALMPRYRNRHLLALDALLLSFSPFFVFALRFESLHWEPAYSRTALIFAAVSVPLQLAIYWVFGLYRRLWRYASVSELERIVVA